MKNLQTIIQEKLKINSKSKVNNSTELLDKWEKKCKDLSCSGTFGLTSGHLKPSDFEGFIPKILSDYFAKRKEYKKMMMKAEKEKYRLIEILKEREKKLKSNLQL